MIAQKGVFDKMKLRTRIFFWTGFIFMLFCGAFGFIQGMPDNVQADPVPLPPTIDQHLQNINSNMAFIKWLGGAIAGLITLLGGALGYIWTSTIKAIHKRIDANNRELEEVKRDYMSVQAHDRICHYPRGQGG
jgi:hypothetical protein